MRGIAVMCVATTFLAACGGQVDERTSSDVGDGAPESGVAIGDSSIDGDTGSSIADSSTMDAVLVDTTPVACSGPGSVVIFWGDPADPIFSTAHSEESDVTPGGIIVRDGGTWSATLRPTTHDYATISFRGAEPKYTFWDLDFATERIGGPLRVGSFVDAQRAAFADTGHPGIDVGGDGVGCNTISGSFEITEVTYSFDAIATFSATFEQHCDEQPPALRGCVHYEL
jgi:hypothetical protein